MIEILPSYNKLAKHLLVRNHYQQHTGIREFFRRSLLGDSVDDVDTIEKRRHRLELFPFPRLRYTKREKTSELLFYRDAESYRRDTIWLATWRLWLDELSFVQRLLTFEHNVWPYKMPQESRLKTFYGTIISHAKPNILARTLKSNHNVVFLHELDENEPFAVIIYVLEQDLPYISMEEVVKTPSVPSSTLPQRQ